MRLVADIGGTNTRCALVAKDGALGPVRVLRNDDHADAAAVLRAGLAALGNDSAPEAGAICVAAPVDGERIAFTNRAWSFSVEELRQRLGLGRLALVNDFTAVALSLPLLRGEDRLAIGAGEAAADAAIAVLGPGTGLGVSGLIPAGGRWVPIAGEGGHVTLAAADEREAEIIAWQRSRLGHVSAERFLSGPGLVTLYESVAGLAGVDPAARSPEHVSGLAGEGDPVACETLALFFAMLGTVAGNLALTLGARGGVFLGGGILPALREKLLASRFRERFEHRGRYSDYLRRIPTYLITARYPALLGLVSLLDEAGPR